VFNLVFVRSGKTDEGWGNLNDHICCGSTIKYLDVFSASITIISIVLVNSSSYSLFKLWKTNETGIILVFLVLFLC